MLNHDFANDNQEWTRRSGWLGWLDKIWLRRRGEGFQPVVLVEGVGRVADVQPIDFDGDGEDETDFLKHAGYSLGTEILLTHALLQAGQFDDAAEVVASARSLAGKFTDKWPDDAKIQNLSNRLPELRATVLERQAEAHAAATEQTQDGQGP